MKRLEPHDPRELHGYRLLGVLGEGGMGRVFLGEDRTGVQVALKVIQRVHKPDQFKRELIACMRVDEKHTARVLAHNAGPEPWLAVEYLRAPTLQELVAAQTRLEPQEVVWLAVRMAQVLRHLAEVGIVHRDIKPANIIVTRDGPKVIDFGIAKDIRPDTSLHSCSGTPRYMSPEQYRCEPPTHASDVYSLGLTLAFAATGKHPVGGPRDDVVCTGLPSPVNDLVEQCVRPRAADRVTPDDIVERYGPGLDTQVGAAGEYRPAGLSARSLSIIAEYEKRAAQQRPKVGPSALPDERSRPEGEPGRKAPEHRWSFPLGGLGYYASPVVADGTVYAGAKDGTVYALDAATGETRWKETLPGKVEHTPAVCDGLLIVPCADRNLYALERDTGRRRWNASTDPTAATAPFPIPSYLRTGRSWFVVGDLLGGVTAYLARDRTKLWRFATEGAVTCPPVVADGRVYAGSSDHRLYALHAADGTRTWAFKGCSHLTSSPVVAGGKVYVGCGGGHLYAVDAKTGLGRALFRANGAVHSLRIADGTLYAGCADRQMYAVRATDGSLAWRFSTSGEIRSTAAVHAGLVLFGSRDHGLYSVDAASGERRGRFGTENWVDSSPAVDGSTVYTGDWDGLIHAIDIGRLGG